MRKMKNIARAAAVLMAFLMLIGSVAMAKGSQVKNMEYVLLDSLYAEMGQCVVSPAGLRIMLSMAVEGAAGKTRDQLIAALGDITAIGVEDLSQVKSANLVLVHEDAAIRDAYATALQQAYGAAFMVLDADVVDTVNTWASEQTDGLIAEVLTEAPDPETMLILLNALLLDADWQTPFDAAKTKPGPFHAADGQVEAQFMHATLGLEYAEKDGIQAVKLPYDGGELEMVVLMPGEESSLGDMLELLAKTGLSAAGDFAWNANVYLALPKFSLESGLELMPALTELGVIDAFDARADFSDISDSMDLYMSDVMQRARIDVDEQGTVAGAVSTAMMANKSVSINVVEMVVNRPFVAVVRGVKNGDVLFAAAVDKPE